MKRPCTMTEKEAFDLVMNGDMRDNSACWVKAHVYAARLERRAKDWAKGAQGGDSYHGEPCTYCDSCNRSVDGRYGKCDVFRPHAHDCDAAIILDLERESAG